MAEPLAGNRSTGFSFRVLRALENAFIYGTKRVHRNEKRERVQAIPTRRTRNNVQENTRAATSKI